ncbi:signal peptide peptidase SppA [Variovorax sp. SG517]|uniref:S49 family peptidase n=1 Tax=Variovorax sp. SG517 TaxID=2587117 RepID=UPI00159E83FF|nr:S49 family peptidase [Variovorax sp. SG517]NVM87624.1 signal peptide peptidase SppA [Variovorax sp. SG517]
MKHAHIAARALNRPLLLEPGYARIFFSALGGRLNFAGLVDAKGEALDQKGMAALCESYLPRAVDPWSGADVTDQSYAVVDGVAVIPVQGSLMHKSGYIGTRSGAMGYDGIQAQIVSALANPRVKGILLDIDSPGGEVAGVRDLARLINAAWKPIWAHANETAASAAYWLGSAAQRLILSETAEVGSIGVLMAHADYSAMLDEEGIKVTLLYAGAHKVDGNPYEALPESVRNAFQADIEELRSQFAEAVAGNRGISTAQVLSTEAQLYRGRDAVEIGLADEVMSFDDALGAFSATLAKQGGFSKGKSMSNGSNASPSAGEISNEQLAQAREAGRAEGHAAGLREGATAERTRIGAILGCDAAKGREATAREFALGTDMAADTAAKLLATVPAVDPAAAAAAATLEQMGNVQLVRPDASGQGGGGGDKPTLAQRVASARQAQTLA